MRRPAWVGEHLGNLAGQRFGHLVVQADLAERLGDYGKSDELRGYRFCRWDGEFLPGTEHDGQICRFSQRAGCIVRNGDRPRHGASVPEDLDDLGRLARLAYCYEEVAGVIGLWRYSVSTLGEASATGLPVAISRR